MAKKKSNKQATSKKSKKQATSSSGNDGSEQKIPSLDNNPIQEENYEEDDEHTPRDDVQKTIEQLEESQLSWESELVKLLLKFHETSKSFVFSPFSIYLGCAICDMATSGHSRYEIRDFLERGCSSEKIQEFFEYLSNRFLNEMKQNKKVKVNMGNDIFVNRVLNVHKEFKKKISTVLNSAAQQLKLTDKLDVAAHAINSFISSYAKIEGTVKDYELGNDIDCFVVNAVSIEAEWLKKFKVSQNCDYTNAEGVQKKHTFIEDIRLVEYSEDEKFRMIRIPYLNSKFSMNIFLPKNSLPTDTEWLEKPSLRKLLDNTVEKLVDIRIPKWSISSDFRLKNFLKETVFGLAFDVREARLKNLTNFLGVRLSQFAHQAVLKVDENGSSPECITDRAEPEETDSSDPISFIANRPFLFVVTMDKNMLFVGVHVDVFEGDAKPTLVNRGSYFHTKGSTGKQKSD